jgi:large subunit ribosomal protein L18
MPKKMGPRWRVQFRRKRTAKTDYRQRLRLLRSGRQRLVIRLSLKHISVQIVRAAPSGDETLVSAHSKELGKLDWKGHTSNLPAAYLVGLLCGHRARKEGIEEVILDIGMQTPAAGGKIFAALKGVLDAGLNVPHGEGVFPAEERIRGDHIAQYAEKLKSEDEDTYKKMFSNYLQRGFPPEQLPQHFNQIKQAIITQHGA